MLRAGRAIGKGGPACWGGRMGNVDERMNGGRAKWRKRSGGKRLR